MSMRRAIHWDETEEHTGTVHQRWHQYLYPHPGVCVCVCVSITLQYCCFLMTSWVQCGETPTIFLNLSLVCSLSLGTLAFPQQVGWFWTGIPGNSPPVPIENQAAADSEIVIRNAYIIDT